MAPPNTQKQKTIKMKVCVLRLPDLNGNMSFAKGAQDKRLLGKKTMCEILDRTMVAPILSDQSVVYSVLNLQLHI